MQASARVELLTPHHRRRRRRSDHRAPAALRNADIVALSPEFTDPSASGATVADNRVFAFRT
jgi:hypothetical protein